MSAALEFKNVSFSYGRRAVMHHVNLTIPDGTFTAVIGPNGGGKSTLLKLSLGLLTPQQGRVLLLGESPDRARPRVGYLPQSALLDLEFPITALAAVSHGRLGRRFQLGPFGRQDRGMALTALEETGCADLANRPLAHLSGGQRQRVLIARALATEPDMLILDEPAAGLDPQNQNDLYDLLSTLAQRLSILVVSHHVSMVSRHVQQVVCLHDGHLHLPNTTEIGPELADFFPDMQNMVLVRHEHDCCPDPEAHHG